MKKSKNYLFPETDPLIPERIHPVVPTIAEEIGLPVTSNIAGEDGGGEGFLGTSLSGKRLLTFFLLLFLLLIVLTVRVGYLDLMRGKSYRALAEGNRLRIVPIASERGIIFDRNGRVLARNIPDFTLTITPADLPKDPNERKALIVRLAEMLDLTPIDIENELNRYPARTTTSVPVREHLEYEKAILLDVQSSTLPGVSLGLGTKREYILDDPKRQTPVLSLSHILGYLGRINEQEYASKKNRGYLPTDPIGKTGIESSYEDVLRGSYGKKQIEVDAFGREQQVLAQENPIDGRDLTLSIDIRLQAEAERLLRTSSKLNGPGRGAAIAMNPRTGEILAMVSWPAFDANLFSSGISKEAFSTLAEDPNFPLFPRAISGTFPPGSTVKLMVAAAALNEGIVDASTRFISSGGIHIGQWFFPDWKYGGHGVTNIVKAIAESVNTYFYAVGGGWKSFKGLGVERLGSYFRRFGLGSPLGIDLPGEASGFVPTIEWKEEAKKEPWYIGDTYHLAIGQGDILVTPLQVAVWTAVFANGGNLVRPSMLKGETPQILSSKVIPDDVLQIVRRGMRETVIGKHGSARGLQTSFVPIAGKTGTAQWRKGKSNHAWFTGFAPYKNPEIVVTVLVEAAGEGSSVAAPVARGIIETWMRLKDRPPESK